MRTELSSSAVKAPRSGRETNLHSIIVVARAPTQPGGGGGELKLKVSFAPSAQLVSIPRGNLISSSDGIYPGNAKLFPLLLGNEGGGFSVAVGRTSGGRFISLAEII